MKRNEKGETLLHVACIEGNLQRVEQLINDVITLIYCYYKH